MNDNWSEFKLRVNIREPLDKVYPAWATPAGLESWFLRKAAITADTALRPGDAPDGQIATLRPATGLAPGSLIKVKTFLGLLFEN